MSEAHARKRTHTHTHGRMRVCTSCPFALLHTPHLDNYTVHMRLAVVACGGGVSLMGLGRSWGWGA